MNDYKPLIESYSVTMDYPDWIQYVSSGQNLLYNEAIRPSVGGGAVYPGHVRQNFMTAGMCPHCSSYFSIVQSLPPS